MKTILLLFLLPLLRLWGQIPATVIHTEANLYQVDSLLYRSEQLVKADKEVILRTPIKTIINLRYFTRSKDRNVFSPTDGITLINHYLLGVSPPRTLPKYSSVFVRHNNKGRYLSIAIMALTVRELWWLCIVLSTTAGVSPQLKKKCSKVPMAIIASGKTWKHYLLKRL